MSEGLVVTGLTVRRGDLTICRDISLEVPPGEITVLLGANGAGKTTLLDGIAGVLPVAAGTVALENRTLTKLPLHRRSKCGLAYAEQGRTVFSKLTVQQNLAVANHSRSTLERSFDLFPRLAEKRGTHAGLLSGGEQQMLVIARALATNPKTLLVDELSLGLAPRVVRALMQAIADLAATGVGILMVEQFAQLALEVGSTAHVMQHGRLVRSATCASLLEDRASLASQYLLNDLGAWDV